MNDAAALPAPDPAAKLVQLSEAETSGVPDQHGVGPRHVEAALDDRGGEQYVPFTVREAHHRLIHLRGLQRTVCDDHLELGNEDA